MAVSKSSPVCHPMTQTHAALPNQQYATIMLVFMQHFEYFWQLNKIQMHASIFSILSDIVFSARNDIGGDLNTISLLCLCLINLS